MSETKIAQLPPDTWPLRFDSFDFGARCYNTLRCSIIFANHQHSPFEEDEPSGLPFSPDWKDHWEAGFIVSPNEVFPPPVEIKWTAMDGVERRTSVDLEAIFPNREILHNVPREEVDEMWWVSEFSRHAEILLEVNDRTINVYMKAWVLTNRLSPEDPEIKESHRDLILAWTKNF